MPKVRKIKTTKQKVREFKQLHQKGIALKVPEQPKPQVSVLAKYLRSYVSPSVSERLTALDSALQWYGEALHYVMMHDELMPTTEELEIGAFSKAIDLSARCKSLSADVSLEDRDLEFRVAIRQMEKCCVKLTVPKLNDYIDEYAANKESFGHRDSVLNEKHGEVISIIEKGLGIPFFINYCHQCQAYISTTDDDTHSWQFVDLPLQHLAIDNRRGVKRLLNPVLKTYFYNAEAASELHKALRQEGVIPVLLRELRILSKEAAAEPSGKGYVVNRDRYTAILEQGLENIEQFCKSNVEGYKLVKQVKSKSN